MNGWLEIITGDWIEELAKIPNKTVQMCCTSPPYWNLRDYKHPKQIGRERTVEEYCDNLTTGFREVRRVMKDNGTLWLNLGDCYANSGCDGHGATGGADKSILSGPLPPIGTCPTKSQKIVPAGCKPKDLVGFPWMVAFALRNDGWYLRCDIIWSKPNPMPESITDRPTRAHEYLFLLSKSKKYYYDHEAIKDPPSRDLIKQIEDGYNGKATKDFEINGVQDASATKARIINGYRNRIDKQRGHSRRHDGFNDRWDKLTKEEQMVCGGNKRSVWTVAAANYSGDHFATFPPDLIKPCILAGSRPGDIILDPFAGSGTTGMVGLELGRRALLIELNPDNVRQSEERCKVTVGLPL